MPDDVQDPPTYSAKQAYQNVESAIIYEEREFYAGWIGWYRKRLEVQAITKLTGMAPEGSTFVDCPCGNGRWFETVAERAKSIVAVDISEGMTHYARNRAGSLPIDVEIRLGDAEQLPLKDGEVDFAFSYALMKHLPVPVQYKVLAEFSRVATKGVVCSFGVMNSLSYAIWRRRKLPESYPVFVEELRWMGEACGMQLREVVRCSTPIGLEHLAYFEK
jgi:ubiquinone/menaquinone biosynthesis C-methylase UbiE